MIKIDFKMDTFSILLIFIGSIAAIIGACLLNYSNYKANQKLLNKAETGIEKSENAINHITGGDSWCYYDVRLSNLVNENKEVIKQHLSLVLEHDGFYPIPEVHIKIFKLVPDKTVVNSYQLHKIHEQKISWFGMDGFFFNPNQLFNLELDDNLKEDRYQVNIGAPNGAITQEIIFKKDSINLWNYATKVERIKIDYSTPDENNRRQKQGHPITLYQIIGNGFPDKQSLGWKDFNLENSEQ